ncbi:unnamed protein product [Chrysoparadoxa australica]
MSISSDEVNYLIYRYLQESGFVHSSFTFAYESLITKSSVLNTDVPPGALITFLQKGLQYVGIEEHLNEDGTEIACDEEFSLLSGHVCQQHKSGKKKGSGRGREDAMDVEADRDGREGAHAGNGIGQELRDSQIHAEEVCVLTNHSSEVFMCAWNPKYDLLASGSGDSTARIWDIPPDVKGIKAAAIASEKSIVLKHSQEVGDKNKDVTTLEWNREGQLLATGSYDGVARIWTREGKLQHTLEAHEGPIFSLKWNAKGNYLLSGSSDKSAIVWDVAAGKVQQRFEYHEAPTLDVDWKDNTTFATCSTDKHINILTVGEKYPRQTFTGHVDEVNAIKWDPSGRLLASCSDDYTAKIWQPDTSKCIHNLQEHKKEIYTIKWSPNPEEKLLLASASFDATVKLWDVDVGQVVATLSRHEDPVYSVAFSPNGDYLASGSFAGHLYIWSVKDGTLVKSYQGDGDIFEVAWNHRADRIAACFSTSAVAIIDFRM